MIAFLKNLKKKNIFKSTVCYCLVSVTERYDIMSASIALANYFASAKGYRTALAVTDQDETVLRMLSEKECISVDPTGYKDEYLTYYCVRESDDLKKLKCRSYERLVLASYAASFDRELQKEADQIRIFGDISPWQYYDIRKNNSYFITDKAEGEQQSGKQLYTASARKCDIARLMKEFGTTVIETGFIKDPYRLEKTDLIKVEKIV